MTASRAVTVRLLPRNLAGHVLERNGLSEGMDLRAQLTVFRRHWLLILQAIILASVAAGVVADSQTPSYEATAQVLLLPGDPSESINPVTAPADITQYASLQAQLVTTPAVASAAATNLNSSDPGGLAEQVEVFSGPILYISATDPDATRAAQIANAFAQGYLDYSRTTAATSLTKTAELLKAQAAGLEAQAAATANPQEAKVLQDQAEAVYTRYITATVNLSLAGPNARLLAEASPAPSPTGSPLLQTVLFGAVAGLLLGLGGAYLREQLDDRVRSPEDAAHAGGDLPILAEVASDRRVVRDLRAGGLEAAMSSPLGEAARALRTAIMFYGVRSEKRRILVTSPGSGDGKTVVSTLLAAAFAQAGFRTMLISADLRRPGAEQLLGPASGLGPGLTDALLLTPSTGISPPGDVKTALAAHIQPTDEANLSFLPAGSLTPNPGELLGSRSMDALLDELSCSHDMLILDSAPLLGIADSRALAEKVDGVVLVTTVGQSKRDLTRARETLGQADVTWLGLVLNRAAKATASNPYRAPRPRAARRSR